MEIRLDQSASPFDLEHTLGCGQVFRWKKSDGWWYGIVGKKVIKVRQIGEKLEFQIFPPDCSTDFIENYFRLDDDLLLIISKIDKDQHIRKAIQHSPGLRIIRQEPWECLISYVCGTYKNIPAIKNMIHNLAKKFGEKIRVDHHNFYTFPKPRDLAGASLEELKKCKLGYRTQYVLNTSRIIQKGEFDLEALRMMDFEKAKLELLQLPGVGQKVADCVLLFSLDKLEAFPVDVWIKRTILHSYSKHFKKSFTEKTLNKPSVAPHEYMEISSFGREYFGEFAGYAQEYLFHYKRFRDSYGKKQGQCVSDSVRKQLK
ncbi:MAG: DNA-3-methyladenine glycosylase [Candidatus Bathyarchaeia archaeon]